MTIVNIQCNEEQKKEEATYKAGDFFIVDGVLSVLVQVAPRQYNLIDVSCGNRYTDDSILRKGSSTDNIYLAEVEMICGCGVVPVESVNISYEL